MPPRILIAEENDQLATSIAALLHRHGIDSERTRDGTETVQRSGASSFDALILGLDLPRLCAPELLAMRHNRRPPRSTPIIALCGPDKPVLPEPLHEADLVCLKKPFRPAALLAALRPLLARTKPAAIDGHLYRAFAGSFSGSLALKSAGEPRTLFFLNGLPVSLRPGFLYRDFGDYLRRKGALSAEEYAGYIDGGRRCDTLIQMGCLEYPDILQEKLVYLTEELVEAFALAPCLGEETPLCLNPEIRLLTVNVPRIFHHGYRRHPRPAADAHILEHWGSRYAGLSSEYFRHANFLVLAPEEKLVLRQLDGSRTLAECFAGRNDLSALLRTLVSLRMLRLAPQPFVQAPTAPFPLRRLFNTLEEESTETAEQPLERFTDLVETEDDKACFPTSVESCRNPWNENSPSAAGEPAAVEEIRRLHAELKGKDHYEIFSLTQGKFSIGTLKERYFAITRRCGPEMLMQLTGAEAQMGEEILAWVAAAYDTLSDVVKKERYDELLGADRIGLGREGDEKFQAQVQFQSGKVFIEMADWDSAEKALQDACNIDPNSGVFLAHLAWAIYKNPDNARSRAMQEKAKQMLNRALTLERTASGFAFKGWMLFEGGQDTLAELEFSKALKLDARNLAARQGLRSIQEKREQEKKGLFRRMFR